MQRTSLEATSQTRCTGGLFAVYALAEFEFFTRLCVIWGSGGSGVSPTVSWIKAEPPPQEPTASQPLTRTYRPHKGKTGISNGPKRL